MEDFQRAIDETILQVDLAGMNAADDLERIITSTENMWFAATNRLFQASKEFARGLRSMWRGTDRAFTELWYLPTDVARTLRRR